MGVGWRSRERVARALSHEAADRLPFDASGTRGVLHLLEGLELPDDVRAMYAEGDFETVRLEIARPPMERLTPYLGEVPEGAEISIWGFAYWALKSVEGYHAGHQYIHPLAGIDRADQLDGYPWPVLGAACAEGLAERVTDLKRDGYVVVGDMSQTILETAYIMRGLEQMFADFHERPEYVHALFGKLGELRVTQATLLAQAGVDVLRIGDDIATQGGLMISLPMYREFIGPHHEATITAARRINPDTHVLYHSDGNLTPLLPDLIAIGVTAINPAQPECMDLAEVKREFGRDLTFWGCMPVQSTFEHGTAADIDAYLEWLMGKVGANGGLVVHFINMIVTPRVEANLRAFLNAFHRVARYL